MKPVVVNTIVESLMNKGFRFINGKYFYGDKEIQKPEKYVLITCKNMAIDIPKMTDITEILTQIQTLSDDELWPDLPIVTEAKKLGPYEESISNIFGFTKKQMLILNRILFHPTDEIMFIVTGVGGSGKSTFLNIVKQLYEQDFAAIPLSELNGFMIKQAVSKRLICSDELGKGELDTKILKTLISKQDLEVNPKYGRPFSCHCQSTLLYCCNKAPKIDCTDSGILRRIVYYCRNKKIENPDTSINKRVFNHDELLLIARRALAYEDDNWFEQFKEDTYKTIMKDNSVYIVNESTYPAYQTKCKEMGLKAFSEPNWRDIKDLFNDWQEELRL